MGFFARLAGTMATFFQIGGPSGPALKDNAGVLESRLFDDSAFGITRGATPVNPNDYATKAYVDASSAAPAEIMIRIPLGLVNAASGTVVPNNSIITRARVVIVTPYSPGATISLGTVASPTLFQTTADNDPQVANLYSAEQSTTLSPAAQFAATIAGAPVAGSGFAELFYVITPNP
jgi:hypothetical protein